MKKMDIIVTRHPALVEYLIEKGIADESTEVITHAAPEKIEGKHVCGVLPHSLSCLTKSFTEVPLFVPAELRGKELSLSQVRAHAQHAVTYTVNRQ